MRIASAQRLENEMARPQAHLGKGVSDVERWLKQVRRRRALGDGALWSMRGYGSAVGVSGGGDSRSSVGTAEGARQRSGSRADGALSDAPPA